MLVKGSGGGGLPEAWRGTVSATARGAIGKYGPVALRDEVDVTRYEVLERPENTSVANWGNGWTYLSPQGTYFLWENYKSIPGVAGGYRTTTYICKRNAQGFDGDVFATLEMDVHIRSAAYTLYGRMQISPDEKHLALIKFLSNSYDTELQIHKITETGLELIYSEDGNFKTDYGRVRYSPDGRSLIALLGTGSAVYYRTGDSYERDFISQGTLGSSTTMFFTPDSRYVMYTGGIGSNSYSTDAALLERSGKTYVPLPNAEIPSAGSFGAMSFYFSPYDGKFYAPLHPSTYKYEITVYDFANGVFSKNDRLTTSLAGFTNRASYTMLGNSGYMVVWMETPDGSNMRATPVVLKIHADRYEKVSTDLLETYTGPNSSEIPVMFSSADGATIVMEGTSSQYQPTLAYDVFRERAFVPMTKNLMLGYGYSMLGAGYAIGDYADGEMATATMLGPLNEAWIGTW